MRHQKLTQGVSDAFQQKRLFLFMALLMLLSNLLLVLYLFMKNERIVLVPPRIEKSFWVDREEVSASYLEEMSLFFMNYMGNQSPKTAAFNREILLKYVDPSFYNDLKKQFLEEEKRLQKEEMTLLFFPTSLKTDEEKRSVTIEGIREIRVGGKVLPSSKETYVLCYAYRGGKLFIRSFKNITKGEPHDENI